MAEKEGLTVEKLRSMTGLTLTDEEAEELVDSIRKLAKILIKPAFSAEEKPQEPSSNEEEQAL